MLNFNSFFQLSKYLKQSTFQDHLQGTTIKHLVEKNPYYSMGGILKILSL